MSFAQASTGHCCKKDFAAEPQPLPSVWRCRDHNAQASDHNARCAPILRARASNPSGQRASMLRARRGQGRLLPEHRRDVAAALLALAAPNLGDEHPAHVALLVAVLDARQDRHIEEDAEAVGVAQDRALHRRQPSSERVEHHAVPAGVGARPPPRGCGRVHRVAPARAQGVVKSGVAVAVGAHKPVGRQEVRAPSAGRRDAGRDDAIEVAEQPRACALRLRHVRLQARPIRDPHHRAARAAPRRPDV
mmetsp:Transcript_92031/g.276173  ORF Transcript_92031/g.276173 Transcript_92031/m.276173 type:complete len:248 (-) Transcript_92031:131-874(-)